MSEKKKTRVIVLGGGISGLSLAWMLLQKKSCEVLLVEKERRVGGHMGLSDRREFFFERGPRMFQTGRSAALLELIKELGLADEMIQADDEARGRYIWYMGKLCKFPSSPFACLFSPLTRPLLFALLTEWKKKPFVGEESIWDFAVRRFNRKTAERMFDPLVVGIYAGDIKRLSVNACFPQIKKWEEEHGSLTRGFFASEKKDPSLFSLRGGSERLLERLQEQLTGKILLGQKVESLHLSGGGITVMTTEGQREADLLFSALPPYALSQLIGHHSDFPMRDIVTVNVGFKTKVLSKKGFGYLVPSHAKEEIYGVIFDSNLFPQQNREPQETRLTVMLAPGGDEEKRAINALKKHLQIEQKPDFIQVTKIPKALPQFELGHSAHIQELQAAATAFSPRLHLVGNYLFGTSVNDAIASCREASSLIETPR